MGDYNSIETDVIRSEKEKFIENYVFLKIPEKKAEIFINLKSPHFLSTAVSVLRTRITQNHRNFLQIDS